ncbi:hypothetical protein L873DRAFT_1794776 [Choiromyces venosus 120613-1]|uniref:DUF580-domain-containing protein n=1 Tax=Choiromyces venosus 120613-1 TaxID=1336337 RepID=A0A3N4J014_9PEZI|nr:hypothetical protein L873DRAFT_1794776 [Choiromyces venosus 120613-1]
MAYAAPTKPVESIIPVSVLRAFDAAYLLSMIFLVISRIAPREFVTSSRITGLMICFGSGIYCIGVQRPLEGLSFIVFGGLNMGLELLFSAGKSGGGAGLSTVMLDMLVEFGKGDLGVFATAALGTLVVLKGWLWYAQQVIGVYAAHMESSGEQGVMLRYFSCCAQIALYTFSAYWISGVVNNIVRSTISGVYVSRYSHYAKPHSWPTLKAFEKSLANIGSLAVGPFKAGFRLHDSSSYIYSYISLHDVSYDAASENYNDVLEESSVAPFLTSSNNIDSCLDSIMALVSFTTAMLVYLYVYSVEGSYFENKVHINALLAFAVWVGFQVSALCMIPLKSGTATIFTILASSPVAFKRDFPAQYYKILETSPGIEVQDV